MLNTPEGEGREFDRIYLAIGSRPANRIVSTTAGIEVDEKGYVKVVDRPFGMTTRRGVFAGGDVVHRPQTVVLAMKAAKEVLRVSRSMWMPSSSWKKPSVSKKEGTCS